MTQDDLVKAAATAALGALTRAVAEPALAAGGRVWGWIRGKAAGAEAETVKAEEADPQKPSAPDKVTGLLKNLLHGNPAAQAELRALLGGEAGVQAVTQTLTISGHGAVGAQIVGSNNQVGNRR